MIFFRNSLLLLFTVVTRAQWWCCGVNGPVDFANSAWYNTSRDQLTVAVPDSCCPPHDVTASLRHRCQQEAARLQKHGSGHNMPQLMSRNQTAHLQVALTESEYSTLH